MGILNGKRALIAEKQAGGPARRLVGLELEWAGIEALFAKHDLAPAVSPLVHRDPVPVYKDGKQVGRATSITWGPTIKKMVGFGSVDKQHEKIGTRLSVEWSVEGERGKPFCRARSARRIGSGRREVIVSQIVSYAPCKNRTGIESLPPFFAMFAL